MFLRLVRTWKSPTVLIIGGNGARVKSDPRSTITSNGSKSPSGWAVAGAIPISDLTECLGFPAHLSQISYLSLPFGSLPLIRDWLGVFGTVFLDRSAHAQEVFLQL